MKLNLVARISTLVFLVVFPFSSSRLNARPDCVRVNLHNNSTFNHTYTIRVEARCSCISGTTWNTAVPKGGAVPIWVCSNHTLQNPEGYGEFWYHIDGQSPTSPWSHATLLHDNEDYSM